MIIEDDDDAHVYIPRLCYHKKLSIAANCSMCLVKLKNRKNHFLHALPCDWGMKVFTRSSMALESQKTVMEFLLINHPLDCPICDQGGECELQDLSMGYGRDHSPFTEGNVQLSDVDIGPIVFNQYDTLYSLYSMCSFCGGNCWCSRTRLTTEVNMQKSPPISKIRSPPSFRGNVIDLCPVGAFNLKPYRYQARAWELKQSPSLLRTTV